MRTAIAILACALACSSVGCPGELENPERFANLPACRGGIDVERLFRERCSDAACHGACPSLDHGLDLLSPNLADRVVGVPSRVCDGLLLVDPDVPENSFLFGKLISPPAGCGNRMPLTGSLTTTELSCIQSYIEHLPSLVTDAGNVSFCPTDPEPGTVSEEP
jgi:hypothetical protein